MAIGTLNAVRSRPSRALADIEVAALEAALKKNVRGEVRFDAGSRALYTTDAAIFRKVPIGVVLPRDADDVVEAMAVCHRFGAPVLGRGGGTSISGNSCNVAVVFDMSRWMNHIIELDPQKRTARVEPGVICDSLRNAAEKFHLTFAPDPSTHNHCCIGGMVGNDSCGIHSVMGGRTADNIEELEILTYDGVRMRVGPTSDEQLERTIAAGGREGEIYAGLKDLRDRYADLVRERYPDIPRRCSGYCLDELLPEKGFNVARALVGSEGTCVLALEATCRLIHSPPHRILVVAGFPDLATGGDLVPMVLEHGPTGLEGIDEFLVDALRAKAKDVENMPLLPEGGGWLYVEFGGETREEALDKALRLSDRIRGESSAFSARVYEDKLEADKVWHIRHQGLSLTRIPGMGDFWPGWEDGAVHPNVVGAYIRDLRKLIRSFGYTGSLFSHVGQGCLHTRTNFDLTSAEGVAKYRAFMEAAADLVVSYGGSLSGEHGDGRFRTELLPKMFGPELVEAFREFKAIWDPDHKMNPGIKVEPAYKLDQDLRIGPGHRPPRVASHFQYPDDRGSFAYATERCIGVGTCRKEDSGTMCPSYMATKEEMHSTRGRSRLLFEMFQNGPIAGGWRDPHVHEALDLCLACKACKSECPNNVDMATYKAEFLAHHYAGRLRPRAAYAMGLVPWWAPLGSWAAPLANFLSAAPATGAVLKALGGISQRRQVPPFAPEPFQAWWRRRPAHNAGRPRVVLWPDTFNNYFHPEVAKAAVDVLENAGFQLIVPGRSVCCGRPLYDFGMLPTARSLLRQVLGVLRSEIQAGISVVVLEPSCAAVFRDEMLNFFPNDPAARRLATQTHTLGGFLARHAPDHRFPALKRQALVHGHCHQKAILGTDGEQSILHNLGVDFEGVIDAGCCGMAGSFGFEADKYDVSMRIGELRLLPAVRSMARDALIVADGFSCKHQIREGTDRQALHLAQVLQMALHEAPEGPPGGYPEARYPDARLDGPARTRALWRVGAALGLGAAAVVAGGALYGLSRRGPKVRSRAL